jgi:adenylate kinase family enzyme
LVSSDLLVNLIKSEIRRNNYTGRYLIDGFPRNVENDDVWRKMMEEDADVKGLIYMKCGEGTMEQRILERAKTSGRPDDNIETLKKRFKVYDNETKPIIEKYQNLNHVIEINAEQLPEAVYSDLRKSLEGKGVYPKNK